MKKGTSYTHLLNVKMTDEQYQQLLDCKANTGIPISKMIRQTIMFISLTYNTKQPVK